MKQNVAELVASMLTGNKLSLARLMTLIEGESSVIPEIMGLISPHLNKAYRVGITGPPGSGKSTLIDKLISRIRSKGKTVGIIAVDPSSAITGGAVLGDRIRMQKHYLDDGVFIRSIATRGSYGGLSTAVRPAIDLLDASGKDIILIETTGVGQTEVDVRQVTDTVVVILVPGYGDTVQLMKAGLIEIADIIVINKADQEGTDNLAAEVRDSLSLIPGESELPVILTQATSDVGIDGLYQEIEKRWTVRALRTSPE